MDIALTQIAEFLDFFIGFLPESEGLPSPVIFASDLLTPYMSTVAYFFPFKTVMYLLTLMLQMQIAMWLFIAVKKVYGWIRGFEADVSNFQIVTEIPGHNPMTTYRTVSKSNRSNGRF